MSARAYNDLMSGRTSEYRQTIDLLPPGARLILQSVSWEQYESLLQELDDRPGVRVSYNEGQLEIVSPLREHERYKEFVSQLVRVLADELDITLEPFGSTTWKRRELRKGVEPDTCFYVANARRVIGKRRGGSHSDPPPDIVVEIDTTNKSLSKFPIYAALGVPEIWRYDGTRVQMFKLKHSIYIEIDASRFLPLDCASLLKSLELSKKVGHSRALKTFRQAIRKQ
jgi:Uma2 family endonuclease